VTADQEPTQPPASTQPATRPLQLCVLGICL
jgi:hypothetical protein